MNDRIRLVVPGIPKPKRRPRVFRHGNRIMAVSPSRQDEEDFLTLAMANRPQRPIEAPISVSLTFYLPAPKSLPKRLREPLEQEILPCGKRPDIDNLAKLVLDALDGVYWRDDGQICHLTLRKVYSARPRTEVEIAEIPQDGQG